MATADDRIRNARGSIRLRARWVVPIDMPPIENGEVVLENGRITSVGKGRGHNPDAIDFGQAAILPGFVNVHAHIEYTMLRGMLEDMPFFPWIRGLTGLKVYLNLSDWVASATLGAAEMLAAGITTVVDASDSGAALTGLIASGQRGIVCREVFGIENEPPVATTLNVLDNRLGEMRAQLVRSDVEDRLRLGVSPHAPYTVRPELFRALAEYAEKRGLMQTIHIAETEAESDLIRSGVGPFAEMFARRDIPWQAQNLSPVAYVERCGGLDTRTLAVHTVHTSADDAALLKSRGASIAHCPKSNGKLAAGFAPLRMLMDAGLDVGLGTDSMVSNNCADMFEEMRMALFQARNLSSDVTALKAKEALFLATQGGANAIGMGDEIGSLRAEKRADLCVVRLDGLNTAAVAADDPIAALVFGGRASDVVMTMVGGKVVYEGGKPMLIDVPRVRTVIDAVRATLWKKAERVLGAR